MVARNAARAADPAFSVTGVSQPTGLHYAWTWNVSAVCSIHFVHLNLFPGRGCGSASNPQGEGSPPPGFPCSNGDLAWAENSLGFLEADLAAHGGPGVATVTIQHYGVRVWGMGGSAHTSPYAARARALSHTHTHTRARTPRRNPV